jgi:hypothetical protein
VLAIVLSLLAILLIFAALRVDPASPTGTVLLNLATEIIGIGITVALVEWLFERRKNVDEAKKLAWRVLHNVDHAVWVWQGGNRDLAVDELLGLISAITDDDPILPFTGNLLMRIGSAAEIACRRERDVVSSNRNLEKALGHLEKLASIRDPRCTLQTRDIRWILRDAACDLAAALDQDITLISEDEIKRARDPSVQGQVWRHSGNRIPVREIVPDRDIE